MTVFSYLVGDDNVADVNPMPHAFRVHELEPSLSDEEVRERVYAVRQQIPAHCRLEWY